MSSDQPAPPQLLHPWLRGLLWVATGLVTIVGLQLFGLSTQTDQFFAWTIKNPLTAAFLGAAYWSAAVLEASAARQTLWAKARSAVPAVLLFTALTLIATLVHLDQFHLGDEFAPLTRGLTLVWLTVYLVVPPALLVLLILQLRSPGAEPPPTQPMPLGLRVIIGAQAALLVAVGALLYAAPEAAGPLWPWPLTVLAARAIGAWLLGLGVAAAQVMLEADWGRAQPVAAACLAFAALQGLALTRFPATVAWAGGPAWVYVLFLVSLLVLGVYGLFASRRPAPAA